MRTWSKYFALAVVFVVGALIVLGATYRRVLTIPGGFAG